MSVKINWRERYQGHWPIIKGSKSLILETIRSMILSPFGWHVFKSKRILPSNRFHDAIGSPKTGFEFSKLHILDLPLNGFTGNLPTEYFQNWDAMRILVDQKHGPNPK